MAPPADLLSLFNFTDGDDVAINDQDWYTWRIGYANEELFSISTGLGNDLIIGYTNPDFANPFSPDRENGFKNRGIIDNPGGSLTVEGYGYPSNVRTDPPEPSYGFVNETLVLDDPGKLSGVITSADADDRLYGYAESYPGELAWGMYLGSQPDFSNGQVVARSLIDLAGGNDEIIAEAYAYNARSHGIHVNWAPSRVVLGDGNDLFNGYAKTEGNDWAVGVKIERGAVVELGAGDDRLEGTGVSTGDRAWGIQKIRGGVIRAGDGNDTITGISDGANSFSTGILNQDDGMIMLGEGDDIIQGISSVGSAIWNQSGAIIDAGPGNDIIDGLKGGFRGSGVYEMGAGNDTLIGSGEGTFSGGTGTDTIALGPGTYTFDSVAGTLTTGRTSMRVSGIEQIRGVNGGGLFRLQSGRFQVDSRGAGFSSDMDPVVDAEIPDSSPEVEPEIDSSETVSSFQYSVYDALTDAELTSFANGDTITAAIPSERRAIVADYNDGTPGDADGSMKMSLFDSDGTLIIDQLENSAPYAVFGNRGDDFNFGPGLASGENYILEVTMFSEDFAQGRILASDTIEFTFA